MATGRSDRTELEPRSARAGTGLEGVPDERVAMAIRELEEALADRADHPHTKAALETLREALCVATTRASQDPLTGIMNRACFDAAFRSAVERAAHENSELALLFLDLDGFKLVNDQRGHPAGDQLLREVAARIAGSVREEDLLARYGGDEFVVALEHVSDRQIVYAIAERIIQCLSGTFTVDGEHLHLSVSVGIALFPEHAATPTALLAHADEAMYQAKHLGGGRYQLFQPSQSRDQSGSYAKFDINQRSTSDTDMPLRRA